MPQLRTAAAARDAAVAVTAQGRLRGARHGDAAVFRGIRYASADRWCPPAPPPDWSGIRDALVSGPASPQPDRPVARFTHGPMPRASEDCLYLDLFTPALEGSRPVFVWIHGGGFAVGHGAATLYDGARFAVAADAVVVSVNYRLGSLGWLAHPVLAETAGSPLCAGYRRTSPPSGVIRRA
jgi:para-nitrobenzyl esterase